MYSMSTSGLGNLSNGRYFMTFQGLGGAGDWVKNNYPWLLQTAGHALQLWGQYEMYRKVAPGSPQAQGTEAQLKDMATRLGPLTPEQKQATIDVISGQFPPDKQLEVRNKLQQWIPTMPAPGRFPDRRAGVGAGLPTWAWLGIGAGAVYFLSRR